MNFYGFMKLKSLLINIFLLLVTAVVTLIIHKVTLLLYFNNQSLNMAQAFSAMLHHNSWFIKGVGVLNYLIKPIFFYIIIWILKEAFLEIKNQGE